MDEETVYPDTRYFRLHIDSFWHWGEGGRVIEIKNGQTLCYREELEKILSDLAPQGLPSLQQILLILTFCKDDFPGSADEKKIKEAVNFEDDRYVGFKKIVYPFLLRINQLPKENRSMPGLQHLLSVLFGKVGLPEEEVNHDKRLVAAFKSGKLDHDLKKRRLALMGEEFRDLATLEPIAARFPTRESLENALRTGLQQPPKPADVPIPEVKPPDQTTSTLLDELEQDPRTCGVAALARHIIAALNIPMQARGSNDMPLGGVSDITNRGNLDRLLLSELAADDLTLMARLANNEALYLRREQPPIKVEKERILLLDTTIKLWGTTRAFAVSAALACQERNPEGNGLQAFALGGSRFADADLSNKTGVVQLLERLDVSLHAALGLQKCLAALPQQRLEVILITAAELLEDHAFAQPLHDLQPKLDYIIALARDGKMSLVEVVNGHRKLLVEATFDLRDLLFRLPKNKRPKPRPTNDYDDSLPAFFHAEKSPIYFPATNLRLRPHNSSVNASGTVMVLTDQRRLLYWDRNNYGAEEIFPYVKRGPEVKMQQLGWRFHLVLVKTEVPGKYWLYLYDQTTRQSHEVELEGLAPYAAIFFNDGILYYQLEKVQSYLSFRKRNFITGTEEDDTQPYERKPEWQIGRPVQRLIHRNEMQQTINFGYSVLQHVKYLNITPDGCLKLDRRALFLNEVNEWRLVETEEGRYDYKTQVRIEDVHLGLAFPKNPELKLRRVKWGDGTVAWLDPRGILHLRSSDPNLPEISIVLVLDAATAMWASNGECTGALYFVGSGRHKHRTATEFNEMYLRPLLQRIKNHP